MKQAVVAVVVLLGLTVRAQADDPPPLEAFLEQRVAEELAADGVLLSRLGVHLDVEVVGDKLLISLVENTTDRASASTKVDAIPPGRDAAVAVVTQVAATLASQLVAAQPGTPAPQPDATAAAVKSALDADREARRAQEETEYKFRQQAIYFGNEPVFFSDFRTFVAAGNQVVPYQGEMRRKVDGPEFYTIVERPDLVARYERNRRWGLIGAIGGVAVALGGVVVYTLGADDGGTSCLGPSGYLEPCNTGSRSTAMEVGGLVMFAGGLGVMGFGLFKAFHPHPTSEQERYELAARYNARLREKHGLPVSARRDERRLQLGLTPYIVGDGAGLVAAGRF